LNTLLSAHTSGIYKLLITHNPSYLLSASDDHSIQVWDIVFPSTFTPKHRLVGHTDSVVEMIQPSGKVTTKKKSQTLLSTSSSGTANDMITTKKRLSVLVFQQPSAEQQEVEESKGKEAATKQECIVMEVEIDHLLLSGSSDHTIKLWNIMTGDCLYSYEGHSKGINRLLMIENDREEFVSGSDDHEIRVWSMRSGQCVWLSQDHTDVISSLAMIKVTSDRWRMVSGSWDYSLRIWEGTRSESSVISTSAVAKTSHSVFTLIGHTAEVLCVEVMRGGTRAISGGKDAQLRIWDLVDCVLLYSFSQHTGAINGLYLMNGGEVTLSTSDDGSVCVWKWLEKTGCRLLGTDETAEKATLTVLSIGSHDILVGSENGMIRHWNWKTGELMESLSSHGECVLDFVEVDDGVVISGGMDNDLRLWNITVE
jgi:WD40 repeat protein